MVNNWYDREGPQIPPRQKISISAQLRKPESKSLLDSLGRDLEPEKTDTQGAAYSKILYFSF